MKKVWNKAHYEKLDWYDLISEMGLETFNWAGANTWDQLLKMTQLPSNAKILMVGCGVGQSAFFLAEKYGFHVVGIDLAEKSIHIAKEKAKMLRLDTQVTFDIGDAHHLPYPNDSFDAIFTEFMAYFLNHSVAIPEFFRVIKPRGYVGFNELMLNPNTPQKPLAKIQYAGEVHLEFSGFRLTIPTSIEYTKWVKKAGFQDPLFQISRYKTSLKHFFKTVGGRKKFWELMKLTWFLYKNSSIIKEKFEKQAIVKKIIKRQRKTAKFITPTLCVARK
ncbi:MAG: class I SAM-dependent methyltransferase [Promethearchaeota archaeon]|nr:MAG: class I SAM-dependent methyltransferase [Candidatus Lokiarchaeota archaeon]